MRMVIKVKIVMMIMLSRHIGNNPKCYGIRRYVILGVKVGLAVCSVCKMSENNYSFSVASLLLCSSLVATLLWWPSTNTNKHHDHSQLNQCHDCNVMIGQKWEHFTILNYQGHSDDNGDFKVIFITNKLMIMVVTMNVILTSPLPMPSVGLMIIIFWQKIVLNIVVLAI